MKSRNAMQSLILCAILFTSVSPALDKSKTFNHRPHNNPNVSDLLKANADGVKAEKFSTQTQSLLPAAEYFLDRQMREEIQASSQNLQEQDGINFSVLGSWKSSFRNRLHFPNNMHRVADFGITVNGADSDTIDAGETIDVGITFPAGTDSFSFDILALAESIDPGTSPVPSYGELSLFDIAFLDDDLPNGAFWMYPDSSDSAAAFEMDDLIYMAVDLVFRITANSDTAEAFLKVNPVDGDETISGNVTGSDSGFPSMLIFQSGTGVDEENWITFTSVYHTIDINHGGEVPFFLSALDVFHSVDSGEYLFTTQQFPADESNLQLNITRNASVSGIVTESESDEPIEGLRVSAAAQSEASFIISYSATDSAGGYELPLQGYSIIYGGLQINHPNYQEAGCGAYSGPHYILPDDERELDCAITAWPSIVEGLVTDEDGNPLPGIMVRIELDNEEFSRTVVTNPNGNYRMGSLLGIAEMCANPQGNLEFQQTCEFPVPINTAAVEQDFTLEGWPAAIRVEVTDEETDVAIPGSRVDVITGANSDNRRVLSAMTNENGIAVIGMNNGSYRVCAENLDLGFQRECQNQVSVTDDTAEVSLALNGPDAFIEGYVFDSESFSPIEGLTIVAFPGENPDINQLLGATDANGFFSIGAQNGYYSLCYVDFTSAYDDTCEFEVIAENGTTTMPVMYLDPIHYDGAITGTVSDQHDMGVTALIIAADTSESEEDENSRLRFTVSGENGEYLMPAMNGTYFLVATPFSEFYLTGFAADISVESDTAEANIETPALIRDAVAHGTVTDSNLTPIEGAGVVFATWRSLDEILPFGAETNENGNYQIRLPGFDDRLYWAVAAYEEDPNNDIPTTLLAVQDSITIASGDTIDIDFTLLPEAFDGLITGTVYVYDDPVSGVALTAHNYQTDRDFETHTDENGRFTLEVDYGEFIVCAHHYAYENEECEGVIVSEEHPEADVDLEYGAPVESLDNIRGNFRFTFGNDGTITRGEWPAGSGRNYLNKGGLVTLGYLGEYVMVGGLVEDSWEPVPESFGGYLGWITRSMTDSGQDHSTYVNVQESIFSPTQNQNFIIVFSSITYDGDFVPLEGFRAGYFMDWDITHSPNGVNSDGDDLTGVLISEVSHPVLGVMIPIKISYMMDNDGDQNQSSGYVGLVTFAGTNMMTGLNHIVFDTDEDPESVEEYAELFDVDEDDENASEPGDYAVGQLTEGISISMGDTLTLTTIVMAAESPQGFIQITQQVLNFLYSLEIGSDIKGIPEDYALHQNYPNPFNPVTTIRFDLPDAGEIRLSVINLLGEEVAVLRNGFHQPGRYSVRWDASDMASGMYFYRISTAEYTAVRKLVLMK